MSAQSLLKTVVSILGSDTLSSAIPQAWATLEQELGNSSTAQRLLEQALQSNPDHFPSYMVRAVVM